MREDMYKVVINRPRYASRFGTRTKLRYLGNEELPARITGKQVLRYKKDAMHKNFSDHVMPLKRYLNSQRGRKWDDVFSEICANLDTGSTVKMHVHEHIDGFILRNVRLDQEGNYWGTGRWGGPQSPTDGWPDLYVCPKDGLIKETKSLLQELGLKSLHDLYREKRKDQRRNNFQNENYRRLSETEFLVRLIGSWFRLELSNAPETTCSYFYSEAEIYKTLIGNRLTEHPKWKVISKKQLSKKELKQHGLKNSYDDGGANV